MVKNRRKEESGNNPIKKSEEIQELSLGHIFLFVLT